MSNKIKNKIRLSIKTHWKLVRKSCEIINDKNIRWLNERSKRIINILQIK
jgi:hypothetical protein